MTVEEYLRSLVPGLDLQTSVVARAARSPIEVGLERLNLDDDVDYEYVPTSGSGSGSGGGEPEKRDRAGDVDFQMRLDYASSTIYYSVLGVFAGGGHSEQVGDVRSSRGGYTITMADRARFKAMGDALRQKWGWETEADEVSTEIVDMSSLRSRR
jgi:hypothetical protein